MNGIEKLTTFLVNHLVVFALIGGIFLIGAKTAAGQQADPTARLQQLIENANAKLGAIDAGMRVSKVEWLSASAEHPGTTIYARDVGNQFLSSDFVRGDLRRSGWSYPNTNPGALVYSIDISPGAAPPYGVPLAEANAAIERAMRTWDAQTCTNLQLVPETGVTEAMDLGYLFYLISDGQEGSPWLAGDIQHTGFYGLFIPGAAAFTFEFTFFRNGRVTDINHDGKGDVAFREIYYSPLYNWTTDPAAHEPGDNDVETIALHEAGHGLSQDHFGTLFIRQDGTPVNTPLAVMNAVYLGGTLRRPQATDVGGHCGIWANW